MQPAAADSGTEASAGIVVIGRDEGQRLARCLASVAGLGVPVVYVDSASRDGSAELARRLPVEVVELDAARPLTAARSRNAGFARLRELTPALGYVQFVDGDTELHPGWLAVAVRQLEQQPRVGMLCGCLAERSPEASRLHRLAALEWDRPAGDVAACGGIAMARVAAFEAAGGFDATLAGGEEPELCHRMRGLGFRIVRLDVPMGVHDSGPLSIADWWRRNLRNGRAFAERAQREGWALRRGPGRDALSVVGWAALGPLGGLGLWLLGSPLAWLLLAAYPALWARIFWRRARRGGWRDAGLYATACLAVKVPQLVGITRYARERLGGAAREGVSGPPGGETSPS